MLTQKFCQVLNFKDCSISEFAAVRRDATSWVCNRVQIQNFTSHMQWFYFFVEGVCMHVHVKEGCSDSYVAPNFLTLSDTVAILLST